MDVLSRLSPGEIRDRVRRAELARPTAGMAPGYVQANLVVVPRDLAFDFLVFWHLVIFSNEQSNERFD